VNKVLKTIFISNGVFVFAASLLGPLYAVFVETIEKDIFTISLTVTALLISSVVFSYLISLFKDKYFNEYLMLGIGFFIRALVWGSYIFVGSISQIIILQVILGFGEAIGSPAFNAIFAEHLDKSKHISEYAKWSVLDKTIAAIGVTAGGFIAANYGFQVLFGAMSVFALAALLVLSIYRKQVLTSSSP